MILSAMIFAGVTMIVGILLGFLLGQARSRMSYQEELRKVEQARDSLAGELAALRKTLQLKSREPSTGPGPAGGATE